MTPRIFTLPLRELTPSTSYGYDVIDFARDVLDVPLDAWQEWAAIHLGELLPDGRPRFRTVLILVARQNGKTLLAKTLALFWLFIAQAPMVLGTSTDRQYAKRVWSELCEQATSNPHLAAELGPRSLRRTIGEEALITAAGCTYKFAATNRRAGRSLTVHRGLLDEIREHTTFDAWNAVTGAMNAVPDGQLVAISNQGDEHSVVLDALRGPALSFIETGQGDPRLGLFEWSAPQGADPADPAALAQANPNLGHRVDLDALTGAALRAKAAGGEELAGFRTEALCQRVSLLDPAIDPDAWEAAGIEDPIDLAEHRQRVALCVDVSLDGSHASLVAAARLEDGKLHVEIVQAWDGYGCTRALRAELPDIVAKVKPRVLGWFPNGPAAAVAADLADRGHRDWPPRRVKIEAIKAETTAVCMGLAEIVVAGELVQPNDAMQTTHIHAATKLYRSEGTWVFTRAGETPVDGAYATAGAVHLARTLPPPLSPVTVL